MEFLILAFLRGHAVFEKTKGGKDYCHANCRNARLQARESRLCAFGAGEVLLQPWFRDRDAIHGHRF